ncbi:hypothetical protein [Thiocystis violacea]|uniref:hypothetical protein n=1 Tax=Thiocystis violacea TaxID=13725 RepID=UPI0019079E4B|nr:hypothetical protein [Thiocystis violacea]
MAPTEPTQLECRQLLKQAKAHKNQLPKTLFLPTNQPAASLSAEAMAQGIDVIRVDESQLLLFIAEVRETFRASFDHGDAQ